MGDFYLIMDMLISAAGVYVVVQYIMMIKSGKVQQNMLLPKDVDAKKCKDPAGYIKYIGSRQLVFGLAAVLCGVLGLIQDVTKASYGIVSMIGTVIFLVCTVWYAAGMRKAMAEYWGRK